MRIKEKFHIYYRLRIVVGLFVIITAGVRLAVLADGHLHQARFAGQQGNIQSALESYTWAIRNHFPVSPYTPQAVQEALTIIENYHRDGKITEEIQGLRRVRAALLSIRSFTQPYKKSLELIEKKLSQITDDNHDSS